MTGQYKYSGIFYMYSSISISVHALFDYMVYMHCDYRLYHE